jgi:glycosyltransferase involved in cell wall biosynthesis
LVQHGATGLLVPPSLPSAIAEAIDRLIADRELWRTLATNGIEKARQFTVEAVTERQVQLLNRRFGIHLSAEVASA